MWSENVDGWDVLGGRRVSQVQISKDAFDQTGLKKMDGSVGLWLDVDA